MKRFYTFVIAVLCLNSMMAQSAPFFPEEYVVTASSLNLRETPAADGRKIASLPKGAIVQFLEAYNNGEYVQIDTTSPYAPWLKVRYKDKEGYVFGAYVTGTYTIAYEGDIVEDIAPLQWYGIYARDSFSDEIKKVELRMEMVYNEMYGSRVNTLKTNQSKTSKLLIGTVKPLKTGYAGPLGMYNVRDFYMSDGLYPGAMLSIYPGQEEYDTLIKPAYMLAATGCASLEDNYVQVKNYQLYLLDFQPEHVGRQDLTDWVRTELPEISPMVSLLWFGDIDGDDKPDAVLQDCPYEAGCRASLFLSSKATKGQYLRKVCEHFWPGE